jgi:hypothetical protein
VNLPRAAALAVLGLLGLVAPYVAALAVLGLLGLVAPYVAALAVLGLLGLVAPYVAALALSVCATTTVLGTGAADYLTRRAASSAP